MDLQKQLDQHEKRMLRIEKELDLTAKLVRVGMQMIIGDRKRQKEVNDTFNYKLNALIEAQQKGEEKLNRLIDFLSRRNSNGHAS